MAMAKLDCSFMSGPAASVAQCIGMRRDLVLFLCTSTHLYTQTYRNTATGIYKYRHTDIQTHARGGRQRFTIRAKHARAHSCSARLHKTQRTYLHTDGIKNFAPGTKYCRYVIFESGVLSKKNILVIWNSSGINITPFKKRHNCRFDVKLNKSRSNALVY